MSERDEAAESRDPSLEALFQRAHAGLGDENFVAATMRRVEAARVQHRLRRRVIEAGILAVVVAASPWLIDGSVKLSALLDAGLSIVLSWLATPTGMALGFATVAAVAAFRPLLRRLAPLVSARDAGRPGNPDPG